MDQETLFETGPKKIDDGIHRTADFSRFRTWRYTLIREWDKSLPHLLFVLLNPSIADEYQDDPTNRRGIGFAKQWGYGSIVFCNLFAIRSPYQKRINEVFDPIGPENDRFILREAELADTTVCAWGVHGTDFDRNENVIAILPKPIYSLGTTKDGHPKHPLYLKSDTKLQLFSA